MGGCATKPKDLDIRPESLPSEAPASPKKPEGENAVAQENVKDGGDKSQKEEPQLDHSEPKQEAGGEFADAQVVSVGESKEETTVEKLPSVEKDEAGKEEITVPAQEEQQAAAVAVTTEAKTEKLDATPSSEDKSDAPLVTV